MSQVTLVTITCSRDFGIQKLQSYSVDKFITEPCEHIIVVEDHAMSYKEWHQQLSPFYTKHKLVLLNTLLDNDSYKNDSKTKNGWHRSALLKLLVANKVTTNKYLVLDSKNFFIKPVELDQWPCDEGNYIVESLHCNEQLANGAKWPELFKFGKDYAIPIAENTYSTTTPFMMKTSVVKNLLNLNITPLFLNNTGWSSELFLYSVYSQHVGNRLSSGDAVNVTFWNNERVADTETLTDIFTWPNIYTFGVHRDFIARHRNLTEFYDFLESINFNREVVESCLIQYRNDINEQGRRNN